MELTPEIREAIRRAVDDTGLVAYIKLYIDDERDELLVIQSCKRK